MQRAAKSASMRRQGLFIAIGLLAFTPFAQAQTGPQRQVRIIVPFAAGGSADVLARLTAQALAARWNQTVVVENRLGAGSHVGAEHVARSPGDGHTLLLGSIGIHAASSVYRNLTYSPLTDLSVVTMLAEFPNVIIVNPSVPVQNLRELVAMARARPGEITFGSAGNATSTHLAGELFMPVTGLRLVHVPYRGSSQALPDVPTAAEAGVEGYVATAWFTTAAPGLAPAPLLQRLNEDLRAVLTAPASRDRFVTLGATPMATNLPESTAFLASEAIKWTRVVDSAGIRLD